MSVKPVSVSPVPVTRAGATAPLPGGSLLPEVSNPERVAAVRRLLLLDTEPEEAFDRLTRLAAHLLGVPVTAVCIVDRDRQFFKSGHGLPAAWESSRQTTLEHSICKHVVATGSSVIIPDTRTDPRTGSDLVLAEMGVMAYAGIPLITAAYTVGTFCAVDVEPRDWSDDDVRLLREVAAIALDQITLRLMERSLRARRQWQGVGSHRLGRSIW